MTRPETKPERKRAPWALRGVLPLMGAGYFLGMAIGASKGSIGIGTGMSIGLGAGAVLGLVLGLVLHPEEFRRRPAPRE